ncbi:MFS transporter [Yokenella regensburgei]|uniref:MFS transporter n=1 Tax=Yokenella regensburgei TaxID=158877 RepID=UPI0013757B70|nr:MFS transporter [Yokenella regensburgei]KAF1366318.1 MFS family permease [Yokenella regensburgei]
MGNTPRVNFIIKISTLLTIGRGVLLPFLVIYLHQHYHLSASKIGTFLGVSVLFSLVIGMIGGYLCDLFSPFILLVSSVALYSLASVIITLSHSVFYLLMGLSFYHATFSAFDISLKSLLSITKNNKKYIRLYIFNCIGWAIGSAIYMLIQRTHFNHVFSVSMCITLTAMVCLVFYFYKNKLFYCGHVQEQYINPFAHFNRALKDKSLLCFIIGCFFMGLVFKGFIHWFSMYLTFSVSLESAKNITPIVVLTNSLSMIILQFILAKILITERSHCLINLYITTLLLAVGSAGLIYSGTQKSLIILAVITFSLGEILITLMEFFVIDYISPNDRKGCYYSIHNSCNLCFLVSPVASGVIISYFGKVGLLIYLMSALLVSLYFFKMSIKNLSQKELPECHN